MSKTNATTKRKKVARGHRRRPRLTTMQLQTILKEIEPMVRTLYCRGYENHQRFEHIEDRLDSISELPWSAFRIYECLRHEMEERLRIHEYRGHGELVSMPEAASFVQPTAAPRPQLRLLKGGLPESAPRAPSSERPQLRLL